MTSIVLDHVSKQYVSGNAWAIHDLSLKVQDGEFIVIVGPSACGKTTTLRLIAGLERLTRGTIRFGDLDVTRWRPRDRNLALVSQEGSLYPHMSISENIAFAMRMRLESRLAIPQRVQQIADDLDIGELMHRRPWSLSAGQRQRAALAKAIVRAPNVSCILLDEPLSNLDAPVRGRLRADLKRWHQQHPATIVLVTHDQEEAMTLGQRIAVLAEGKLHQFDTPDEVFHSPANRFVAGFFGAHSMNFFDGQIVEDDGHHYFVEAGGTGLRVRLDRQRSSCALGESIPPALSIGIRPSDMTIESTDAASKSHVHAHVQHIDMLGEHIFVHLRRSVGSAIIVRESPDRAPPLNSAVGIHVNPQRMHFFQQGPFGAAIRADGESHSR